MIHTEQLNSPRFCPHHWLHALEQGEALIYLHAESSTGGRLCICEGTKVVNYLSGNNFAKAYLDTSDVFEEHRLSLFLE